MTKLVAAALAAFSTFAAAQAPAPIRTAIPLSDPELDQVSAGSVILILFNPGRKTHEALHKNATILINSPAGVVEGTAGAVIISNPAKPLMTHCISIRNCGL